MNDALDNLKKRGFFQQCTDVQGLSDLMDSGPVTFYLGVDPTGPSVHIGHMVPFFSFRHLLEAGHKGIALVGGGTARIGDPSGKTEMRKILSYEELDANAASIKKQITRFFEGSLTGNIMDNVIFANNKDWLADLNYIDFLRDIGSHFSVNRMLTYEAYKIRMETGLSFIEFNYQLLQSYDFLQLFERHGCRLQIGGDDQWGNITAGADLIRRIKSGSDEAPRGGERPPYECFGLTYPLISRADGKKMGKSEKGAIFLDPEKTSVYDFFQYWRNVPDQDVRRFLLMFTFLPIEECEALSAPGKNPNEAKERLAWEVTALIHGKDEADKALAGAQAAFGKGAAAGDRSALPTAEMSREKFESGYGAIDLFFDAGLCATKSDARRLIQQGGAFIAEKAVKDVKASVGAEVLDDAGEVVLRAGKKRYLLIKAL